MSKIEPINDDVSYVGLAKALVYGIPINDMANRSPHEIQNWLQVHAHTILGIMTNQTIQQQLNQQQLNDFWNMLNENSQVIDSWDFFWEKSERATYLVWMLCKQTSFSNINHYSILSLPNEVDTHEKRLKVLHIFFIINSIYFDNIEFIQLLKEHWGQIVRGKLELKFLDEMKPELTKWLFDKLYFRDAYILNTLQSLGPVSLTFSSYVSPLLTSLNYNRSICSFENKVFGEIAEAKLAIQNFIDIRYIPIMRMTNITLSIIDEVKYLKDKISRMYAQKLYQFNKQQLKPFNTYIDVDSAKKFKKLQKHYGFSKEDMLTYLILEAASKIK